MPGDETPSEKTVGRYQILGELGRGAMAVVYKGKDPVIGRTVALKTLLFRDDNKEMRDLRQSLYRDACAAGTLAHPNIVTIYDVIEEAGMTAVAMEFIEGRTLEAIIRETAPFSVEMALDYFDQIVAGLDYAHTKGIIHRDVKPANIMLTIDGRVKVTDFGVARVTSGGSTMTVSVVGSPSYMSPEQVRGGKLDGRSDLFSAATVLYEMLTKSRPFPGDDIATTMYRIVHELPTSPAEFNPAIGPELTRVFERAMAKDPNERYATGAELAKAMRQAAGLVSGNSTASVAPVDATIRMAVAPAPRPAVQAARPAARAREAEPILAETKSSAKSLAIVGGIAAVLVLAAGGYFMFGGGRAETGSASTSTTIPVQAVQQVQAPPVTPPVTPSNTGGQVAEPPSPTLIEVAATEAPLQAKVDDPPPAPAPQAVPPPSRRGSPGGSSATGSAPSRRARGSTAQAPPAQSPAAMAQPPAAATTAPPPEPAAPVVATVSVSFDVRGDFYSGMQVTVDGRRLQGDWPVTERLRVGTHSITYSWTSGARQGTSITETVTLTTDPRNGYRIVSDPANSTVRAIALN